jgi:hypothetical protein
VRILELAEAPRRQRSLGGEEDRHMGDILRDKSGFARVDVPKAGIQQDLFLRGEVGVSLLLDTA